MVGMTDGGQSDARREPVELLAEIGDLIDAMAAYRKCSRGDLLRDLIVRGLIEEATKVLRMLNRAQEDVKAADGASRE